MRNLALFFLLFFVAAPACKKDDAKIPDIESRLIKDLSYGSDPLQKMDVHFPKKRSSDSTVLAVLIHGGSWTNGDKADLNQYIDLLKSRLPGYALANINYRLATSESTRFPTQENDVHAAVNFLKSKTSEFGISDKLVIIGASAGGHLGLLEAYKNRSSDPAEAVVSFFGPTDLTDMYNNPVHPGTPVLLTILTGSTPQTNPEIYRASSPINYVTTSSPPTLLLQGGKDSLVAVSQQTSLKSILESKNVPVELVVYPDAGHGFYGTNLPDAMDKLKAFLEEHVN